MHSQTLPFFLKVMKHEISTSKLTSTMSTLKLKTFYKEQTTGRELHNHGCRALVSEVVECLYSTCVETAIPNIASFLCHRESGGKSSRQWRALIKGFVTFCLKTTPRKTNKRNKNSLIHVSTPGGKLHNLLLFLQLVPLCTFGSRELRAETKKGGGMGPFL